MMEAQFEAMEGRLEELTVATAQPEIIADVPKWQGMLKEMAQLEPAVNAWRQYRQLLSEIEQAKEMRYDPDMGDMAEEELKELLPREEQEREKALEKQQKKGLLSIISQCSNLSSNSFIFASIIACSLRAES